MVLDTSTQDSAIQDSTSELPRAGLSPFEIPSALGLYRGDALPGANDLDPSIEEQILSALELFHYSTKYRNQVFLLHLPRAEFLGAFLADLRVLQTSHIQVVLCVPHGKSVQEQLLALNRCGYSFDLGDFTLEASRDPLTLASGLRLLEGRTPVVWTESDGRAPFSTDGPETLVVSLAEALRARKVFFAGDSQGLLLGGRLVSHTSSEELCRCAAEDNESSLAPNQLEQLAELADRSDIEMILLQGKTGELFKEIFTHRGSGTLIGRGLTDIIRPALPSDVRDIALVMKPYVRSGVILPISESDILRDIDAFFVATANGEIVATAKLHIWEEQYGEIAKLASLPRYRGRGRAMRLVQHLLTAAESANLKAVFSLTTETRTGSFFESLGFREVPRETLPAAWREKYDMNRPSRGYLWESAGEPNCNR